MKYCVIDNIFMLSKRTEGLNVVVSLRMCIYRLYIDTHTHAHSLPTPPLTLTWSLEHALQRWHSTISVFAHIFLAEGPGSERSNFLNARAGFASRMAR